MERDEERSSFMDMEMDLRAMSFRVSRAHCSGDRPLAHASSRNASAISLARQKENETKEKQKMKVGNKNKNENEKQRRRKRGPQDR